MSTTAAAATGELRGATLPNPRFRLAPLPAELAGVRGYKHLQTFFPTLSKLYRLSKHQASDIWFDTKLRVQTIDISGATGLCSVLLEPNVDASGAAMECQSHQRIRRAAYLKATHLLDPIRWMRGGYSLPKHAGLPWHPKTWSTAWHKLQDPGNQAYVEAVASYALGRLREEGASPHFNLFYGAFCAEADIYRYNVSDDFWSYRHARWFWNGMRRQLYSLKFQNKAHPDEPIDQDVIDELMNQAEVDDSEEDDEESELDVEELSASEKEEDTRSSVSLHSDDAMDDVQYASSEGGSGSGSGESEGSDSDDESDDDELAIYAEFKDFPVMLLLSEANQGTMDELLDKKELAGAQPGTPEWEQRWSAWLFQVCAALSTAQAIFGFTHNDLHTNNIVWSATEEEFLYYKLRSGAVFRVPTFGKLFRIIDFGRSIFRINSQIFISDDFKAGNDAEGQYAFPPLNPKPRVLVPPNASFDLCRLAVSLFDGIFPKAPAEKEGGAVLSNEDDGAFVVRETVSALYNMLWGWLLDEEGRNVLIEPDGAERFPDFDLYKHIAAKVRSAVPSRQFSNPALDRFQVNPSEVGEGVHVWSLFA